MANFILSAFSDECGEATLSGQIAACKANGITHMELRGFGKEMNINKLPASAAKEMRRELDDSGMRVGSIGSGYGKINIKEAFAPHFEAFKRTVEVANIFSAPYIRLFSFYFDAGDDHAANRERVLEQVQTMADYAYANGVLACHENEKGIYGDTADRCLDLLQNCSHLRGVFDPANFVQCGEDTLRAFELLAPYTEYLHMKDALFADASVVPVGEGDGNVKAILSAVSKRTGDVMLTLEPHLQVFDGLQNLETGGETRRAMPKGAYESHAASFKAAADALHALLQEIGA
ncbi:MAG: sugar phosphate isomerase/epimerase [Clostridia bacterium]|nr:sugar phosphate isomerase/epimerase [Clostridia bacterium]